MKRNLHEDIYEDILFFRFKYNALLTYYLSRKILF